MARELETWLYPRLGQSRRHLCQEFPGHVRVSWHHVGHQELTIEAKRDPQGLHLMLLTIMQ
jgi:hypothetical protein